MEAESISVNPLMNMETQASDKWMRANPAPKRAPVKSIALALALLALLAAQMTHAGLFSPRGDSPEEKRQVVLKQRDEMLAELYKAKPELKSRIQIPAVSMPAVK
jgi:hypothetical protein